MSEQPQTTDLEEREWTDQFGTHYEARVKDSAGRMFLQKVTRSPLTGWPPERGQAAANVLTARDTAPWNRT